MANQAGYSLVEEFKKNRSSELALEVVECLATQFQADLDKETDIKDVTHFIHVQKINQIKCVLWLSSN
jgi:hypothetical protein